MPRFAFLRRLAPIPLLFAAGCFDSCEPGDDRQPSGSTVDYGAAEDRIVELYFDSFARPADFDEQLDDTRELYDTPAVHACLQEIAERLVEPAQSHREQCDTHVNPQWRNDCLDNNDPASVIFWAVDMRSVLEGSQPWANTQQGQAAMLAEQVTDLNLGEGAWEDAFEDAFERYETVIRLYLDCT
ncbi:MAG: hypothetical protein AAF799_09460 [Myxococcota bacterium]